MSLPAGVLLAACHALDNTTAARNGECPEGIPGCSRIPNPPLYGITEPWVGSWAPIPEGKKGMVSCLQKKGFWFQKKGV